jgi:hypothetical protein
MVQLSQAVNKQENSRKGAKAQRILKMKVFHGLKRPPTANRISLASLRLCVRLILHFENYEKH